MAKKVMLTGDSMDLFFLMSMNKCSNILAALSIRKAEFA